MNSTRLMAAGIKGLLLGLVLSLATVFFKDPEADLNHPFLFAGVGIMAFGALMMLLAYRDIKASRS